MRSRRVRRPEVEVDRVSRRVARARLRVDLDDLGAEAGAAAARCSRRTAPATPSAPTTARASIASPDESVRRTPSAPALDALDRRASRTSMPRRVASRANASSNSMRRTTMPRSGSRRTSTSPATPSETAWMGTERTSTRTPMRSSRRSARPPMAPRRTCRGGSAPSRGPPCGLPREDGVRARAARWRCPRGRRRPRRESSRAGAMGEPQHTQSHPTGRAPLVACARHPYLPVDGTSSRSRKPPGPQHGAMGARPLRLPRRARTPASATRSRCASGCSRSSSSPTRTA